MCRKKLSGGGSGGAEGGRRGRASLRGARRRAGGPRPRDGRRADERRLRCLVRKKGFGTSRRGNERTNERANDDERDDENYCSGGGGGGIGSSHRKKRLKGKRPPPQRGSFATCGGPRSFVAKVSKKSRGKCVILPFRIECVATNIAGWMMSDRC